jgi:hypothetical protein
MNVRAGSLLTETRYALRGIRRAPLFAVTVSATIGLVLGVLCSAFAIVNAYLLRPDACRRERGRRRPLA